MRTIELDKHRRMRVWFNELPTVGYPAIRTLEGIFQAEAGSQSNSKAAAIELYVPLGARSMYGLLGGRFVEDNSKRLIVDVKVSMPKGNLFTTQISGTDKTVFVGLPAEYCDAIFLGVGLAKEQAQRFVGGRLSFDHAAHSEVDSSSVIFTHLAAVLTKLLHTGCSAISDEDITKLLPERFGSN